MRFVVIQGSFYVPFLGGGNHCRFMAIASFGLLLQCVGGKFSNPCNLPRILPDPPRSMFTAFRCFCGECNSVQGAESFGAYSCVAHTRALEGSFLLERGLASALHSCRECHAKRSGAPELPGSDRKGQCASHLFRTHLRLPSCSCSKSSELDGQHRALKACPDSSDKETFYVVWQSE